MNNSSDEVELLKKGYKFSNDLLGKLLFSHKAFLANFLKSTLPMFEDMELSDIINQSIDFKIKDTAFLTQADSEEGNYESGIPLRKDFVKLLRYPDYMQNGEIEKYFVFHADFEYDETDVDRRDVEYLSNLNNRYNIVPYRNEKERRKYFKPIYSFWIILNPALKKQGNIINYNYGKVGKVNEETGRIEYDDMINSTIPFNNYRIFLDRNLNQNLKEIPNVQGLLQPFLKKFDEVSFNHYLDIYDLINSSDFIEEAEKMDIFTRSYMQTARDETNEKNKKNVIQNLIKMGMCKTYDEAEDLANSLFKDPKLES